MSPLLKIKMTLSMLTLKKLMKRKMKKNNFAWEDGTLNYLDCFETCVSRNDVNLLKSSLRGSKGAAVIHLSNKEKLL
jgi:hypothetical protein